MPQFAPMKESTYPITAAQLRRAATIQEKIEALQNELISIFSSVDEVSPKAKGRGRGKAKGSNDVAEADAPTKRRRKRRKLTPEAREAIASAQRKRWAEARSKKASS
jgi:uncharacterized protein (UPF0335 family)